MFYNPKLYIAYLRDYLEYKRKMIGRKERFLLTWRHSYPFLADKAVTQGFDRHYVYHSAWAMRIIAAEPPALHVDIGSDLRFVTQLSAFIPVHYFDYRPTSLGLSGMKEGVCDLAALPFADKSLDSLSCMHVVEHVGLGRYGDPISPDGDLLAMRELARVVALGGSLFIVVPIGSPRLQFNAHRIYSFEMICTAFSEFKLKQFALIPDKEEDGGLVENPDPRLVSSQIYGCGCFLFVRPDT